MRFNRHADDALIAVLLLSALAPGCCPPGGPMPDARLLRRGGAESLRAGAELLDGTLLLGGTTQAWGWVLRADPSGRVEWHRRVGGDGQSHVNALVRGPGETLVLAGGTDSTTSSAWLVALDLEGQALWQRHIRGGPATTLTALASAEGGGLIAAGQTEPEPRPPMAWTDALVLGADDVGETVWKVRLHDVEASLRATSIVATDDGAVVAGIRESGVGDRGWMARLSEAGEVVWALDLGADGGQGGAVPRDLVATPDGEIVAVGSVTDGPGAERLWVARVSLTGELIEQLALVQRRSGTRTDGEARAYAVVAEPAGGFFVVGEAGPPWSQRSLLTLRLDENLELGWVRLFHTQTSSENPDPSSGDQVALDVVPLRGGGRAVLGFHEARAWSPPSLETSGWLLLLDAEGELGPGCMASFEGDLGGFSLGEGWATVEALELVATRIDTRADDLSMPIVEEPEPGDVAAPLQCPPPHCHGFL